MSTLSVAPCVGGQAVIPADRVLAARANLTGDSAKRPEHELFHHRHRPGKGGSLGGLAGADRHCQALAQAVGAGGKTWRAYLSAAKPQVDAHDRIGGGPWPNAKGVLIARNLDELHGAANKIDKQTGLNEKGGMVNGRGDRPNMHDILTGSNAKGRLQAGMTCNDWTSDDEGRAFLGHHDRRGMRDDAPSKSWNASHPSRGCKQENLRRTGGNGLFYCFAVR